MYPCYLNSEKTVREGRKIRKDKAHKNPTAYHIAVAVQSLGLSVVYEVIITRGILKKRED